MSKLRRSDKRKELMGIILREAGKGVILSQEELYDLCSYKSESTFGAIRVSIRFMEQQGLVERQKTGRVTKVVPTLKGYDWFRPLQ